LKNKKIGKKSVTCATEHGSWTKDVIASVI